MVSFLFFLPFFFAAHQPVHSNGSFPSEFQKIVDQTNWELRMPEPAKNQGVLSFGSGDEKFQESFILAYPEGVTQEQKIHCFYKTNEDLLTLLFLFHSFTLECLAKKKLKQWHFVFSNLQRFMAATGFVVGLVLLLGEKDVDKASFENLAVTVVLTGMTVFSSRWQSQVKLVRQKREEIDARLGDLVKQYEGQEIQKTIVRGVQALFRYPSQEKWVSKVPCTFYAGSKHLVLGQEREPISVQITGQTLPEKARRFFDLSLEFEGQKRTCKFYYKLPFREEVISSIGTNNKVLERDYNQLFSLLYEISETYRASKLFYKIWMERVAFFQNLNNFVGSAVGALALASDNSFIAIVSTLITNGICFFLDLFNTFFLERKLDRAIKLRVPIDQELSELLTKYSKNNSVFLQMRRIVTHIMGYPAAEWIQKFPLTYSVFEEYDKSSTRSQTFSRE